MHTGTHSVIKDMDDDTSIQRKLVRNNNDRSAINYATDEQFLQPQAFNLPQPGQQMETSNGEQEMSIEQGRLEARRESNRRSTQNGRLRQKNLIATLQAENQLLRTELTKALSKVEELKLTLHEETERALYFNRCLQLLVMNNMKDQQQSREGLHHQSGISSTVSSGPTISRLLELANSTESSAFAPSSTSSFNRRVDGNLSRRNQQDEPTANGFAFRRTSYGPTTRPSGSTDRRHHNIDSGSYMSSSYSSVSRAGNSDSTATELEQLDRLQEELNILKSRM